MERIKTVAFSALLAPVLLLSLISRAWAQWAEDGVPLCTATGVRYSPLIASDFAGGAIVVWEDRRSGNSDIYVQRVDTWGTVRWEANGDLLCEAVGEQLGPAVVSDGSGGAIVAWTDDRSGFGGVYAQRIDASGTGLWSPNGVALAYCAGLDVAIAADGANGAVVSWTDFGVFPYEVYAQRVDASGTVRWGASGVAVCSAPGNQMCPAIASDGAGGAILTWVDDRSGHNEIYAQRVSSSGVIQWALEGVALCTAAGHQGSPKIVPDGSGGAIVVWDDGRPGAPSIYAQQIDASGTAGWTADGVRLCGLGGYYGYPAIAFAGAGGAIVTWQLCSECVVCAQRVDGSGVVQWTVDGLLVAPGGTSAIVSDGQGGAIVAFCDARGYTGDDIYAQRIDHYGICQWTEYGQPVCTANGGQGSVTLAKDCAGGSIIAWMDFRDGNYDIYAQRVTHLGNIGSDPVPVSTLAVGIVGATLGSLGLCGLRMRRLGQR